MFSYRPLGLFLWLSAFCSPVPAGLIDNLGEGLEWLEGGVHRGRHVGRGQVQGVRHSRQIWFKGTVSRDFLLLVCFMNQFPPSLNDAGGKLPPVSTTLATMVAKFATRCRWYRWFTLTCEYLREFSKQFEMAVMIHSGAGGKTDLWEKPEVENLVALSLKAIVSRD
jgi:hypothetical protein